MNKKETVSYFGLNKKQIDKIEFFIASMVSYNKHTNLIGRSTIENIWDRHVLDCLQLTKYINKKTFNILDLGTGAGLPGLLFSIMGYNNVIMIESIKKKTDFIKIIIKELSLSAQVHNKRIEKLKKTNQDIIVSRALAPLPQLLTYARMHSNKNTTSLFLKGRNVNNEIDKAMKHFIFDYDKIDSVSSGNGCILQIKNIELRNA